MWNPTRPFDFTQVSSMSTTNWPHTIIMTVPMSYIGVVMPLFENCNPQMTLALVCAIAYAILIIHIWPATRDYEKNWHQISPIKPCINPDRWAFLCCLLGLYSSVYVSSGVNSLRGRNNKRWPCHRGPSDLVLIWRCAVTHTADITHRHRHTCPRTWLQALNIFVLPLSSFKCVGYLEFWAIKASAPAVNGFMAC